MTRRWSDVRREWLPWEFITPDQAQARASDLAARSRSCERGGMSTNPDPTTPETETTTTTETETGTPTAAEAAAEGEKAPPFEKKPAE